MNERESFTLSKSRFEAFSDGVFAIAITLLILEIHLPVLRGGSGASSVREQLFALLGLWPSYLVYAASFATIGIMWINHHALFRYTERITHGVTVANLVLLGFISFLPFVTEALGTYGLTPVTVVAYGLVLTAIAWCYTLVFDQVLAAEEIPRHFRLWNLFGLLAYPIVTAIGFFFPLGGVVATVLLACFYMAPGNVASAAVRPRRVPEPMA